MPQHCIRRSPFSLHSLHFVRRNATLSNVLKKIRLTQPSIKADSRQIEVLNNPQQFYTSLLDGIKRARERIFLSSLYVGHDEHELVRDIPSELALFTKFGKLHTLKDALHTKPNLQVHLQLDYFRSTRPGPDSTALALLPLLKSYPDRFHVHLYRSPTLKGLMAKVVPRRFDEGWGTWHAKFYCFDDDVILSGANLNRSYFVDRQDRYLVFSNNKRLIDYCFGILKTFARYSYRLGPSHKAEDYALEWTNPETPYSSYIPRISQEIKEYQEIYRADPLDTTGHTSSDVELLPMIQSGPLDIREEESTLMSLLSSVNSSPETVIDLTSGYFALYLPYQMQVFASQCQWRILAASPKANGFYGSKGVSGRIPDGYTILEKAFWEKVKRAGKEAQVGMREWEREGWTYHAKGIWIRPSPDSDPAITVFGSTNLNSRSANLDTELSFILRTESEQLRTRLGEETRHIWMHSNVVGECTWAQPERVPSLTTRIIAAMVMKML
ncbi:CDP-diacylglycerol--glycerol-3-phosphate 3-phosphatidyltransferase [Serendipita sp. 405]|nr:CDP-diacylglycerol--glycerol-3-phosphate 3-phosphatidyltransferase [Serendipita sp. 405]